MLKVLPWGFMHIWKQLPLMIMFCTFLYWTAYCVKSIFLLLPEVLNSHVQKTSCFVFLEIHPTKPLIHTEMHIKGPLLALPSVWAYHQEWLSEVCFTTWTFVRRHFPPSLALSRDSSVSPAGTQETGFTYNVFYSVCMTVEHDFFPLRCLRIAYLNLFLWRLKYS